VLPYQSAGSGQAPSHRGKAQFIVLDAQENCFAWSKAKSAPKRSGDNNPAVLPDASLAFLHIHYI
jgi:hypothetical protein